MAGDVASARSASVRDDSSVPLRRSCSPLNVLRSVSSSATRMSSVTSEACCASSISFELATCWRARKSLSAFCALAMLLSVCASCSSRNSAWRLERSRAPCTFSVWKAWTVLLTTRWALRGSSAT